MSSYKTICCWMLTGLLLLVGCIPSLNPIYTDETLTFDPALLGVWKQPGAEASWEMSRLDDKSYRLVYTDDQGQHGRFVAHLAQLEDELFLDVYPKDAKLDANGFYKIHLLPIHTIYRVRKSQGQVALAAIDFKWLEEYLTNHPGEIACATLDGRILITANTPEVQKFVLAHKDRFTSEFPLVKQENTN